MSPHAREEYLETEVFTASPQKLQLLLIEAAIRLVIRAREQWNNHQDDEATESLIRCQEIVTEIIAGLRPQPESSLTRKVAAIYAFIFRSLVQAALRRDDRQLANALSVLEVERDTWRQLCDQLPNSPAAPPVPQSTELFSFSYQV